MLKQFVNSFMIEFDAICDSFGKSFEWIYFKRQTVFHSKKIEKKNKMSVQPLILRRIYSKQMTDQRIV